MRHIRFAVALAILLTPGIVSAQILLSVTTTPSTVIGGGSVAGQVTISAAAPATGFIVSLTRNSEVAYVPASITVPAGSTTANFTVTTIEVTQSVTVTLTATAAGASKTRQLIVGPSGPTALTFSPATVPGGQNVPATVTMNKPAPAGGWVVQLTTGNQNLATVPATVTVAAGASSANFTVTTKPIYYPSPVTITATLGSVFVRAPVNILSPVPSALTFTPASVVGGQGATGQVTLSSQTLPQGQQVYLTSSQPSVVTVPQMIVVGATGTGLTGIFPLTTVAVNAPTTVTITADSGGTQKSASFAVAPIGPASVTVTPSNLPGGKTANGQVSLTGPAASPVVVSLASSNTAAARVPASATVAAGASTAGFTVDTFAVAQATSANVTATVGGLSKTTQLLVTKASLLSVTVSPLRVKAGTGVTGQVSLNGPAPSGGLVVQVNSSFPTATTAPTSVSVPAGQSAATFNFTTKPGISAGVTLTATLDGVSKTATLAIYP